MEGLSKNDIARCVLRVAEVFLKASERKLRTK
jgi:hypothetical protein